MKVELDLSNHVTKSDLKNATGVDTSSFAKKIDSPNSKSDLHKLDVDKVEIVPTNLNNLKNKVDKLDVDNLVHVSVDLTKLCDRVKIDVVKTDVYRAKMKDIADKIPDITNLAANTPNTKINKIANKIPSITNVTATAALTNVENKMPNVSDLVKKKIMISEMEKKCLTTSDYNKFMSKTLDAKII